MYSPRSVSIGVTPGCSSASLRSISSVAIDFDFTAVRTPRSRQSRSTISRASSAVAAQCTCPPRRSTLSASRSRCSSRRWSVASLIRRGLVAEGLACREAREGLAAQVDELRGGDRERLLQEARPERRARARAGNGVLSVSLAHRARAVLAGEHLGQVQRAHARAACATGRPPSASGSPRRRRPGSRPLWLSTLGELLVQDGRRHLGQPHREGSAEAAALVRPGQLDQLHAGHAARGARAATATRRARAGGGRSRGRSRGHGTATARS